MNMLDYEGPRAMNEEEKRAYVAEIKSWTEAKLRNEWMTCNNRTKQDLVSAELGRRINKEAE